MQFQVPQFIETEDKIVGPLSLKQFIYIGITGGISLILYLLVELWLWLLVSLPLVAIGIALAFVKIGGRSLPTVARAAFFYFWKPQTYVWQPQDKKTAPAPVLEPTSPTSNASLEEVLSGLALRKTWQKLQTGTGKISPGTFLNQAEDQFAVFRKKTGERHAARRVDYR
ncbi:MAG: PrgI family protein [Candidatus Liptonbacteria bacterium]|nr:PrgI family protein [Candidatus Liptonbacteria bacterium]